MMGNNVMVDDQLYKMITAALRKQTESDVDIRPEMLLKEDLGITSIKLVFFITEITGKLELSIMDFFDYELLKLNTVLDIYGLLSKKVKE